MNTVDLKNKSVNELVIQFQNTKSNDIFGELYHRYYSKLFAYCKKITGEREDAYDITTNTFVKAAEKINQLSSPELFPSWLFRIAHNMCMDHGKVKQKNKFVNLEDQYQMADVPTDMDALLEKEAMLNQLEVLMEGIDPDAKAILVEKYLNNKSVADLQIQFNISASAVKMRLARARKNISKLAAIN